MIAKDQKKMTILIVDDTQANIDLLEAILSPDYNIMTASSGKEALSVARESRPDLIMLDIMMPVMNGYDVCRALKADAATKRIPVIFVTSMLKTGDEALGFEVGGVDYITKPFVCAIVRTRVKAHMDLKQIQDELETQNEELRRAQKELEVSRNKYAELYDFAPTGYFTFDMGGHIQEANLTGARLLGVEWRLLNNLPFIIFVDDDDKEIFLNYLRTVLHRQEMQKCELRLIKKDGSLIYVIVRSVKVGSIDGQESLILSSIVDATAAKKLETEIQDAREYAENIVETMHKPLLVLNSSQLILTANSCFYDTFKVTPEETIGRFICDIGNRQWDIPELQQLFEGVLLNHTVFNGYEVEHDFQVIGRKTILLNAREIFRGKVGAHIILLAMEDITERKQLQEERARLAMIVQSSNDAIFCVSQSDVITSWNEGAENIFGYPASEIIGSLIYTIMPAELHHERSYLWQTILSGEQLQYFETPRIRKDGTKTYVSISASPLLNTEGEIVGNSVIARDVTERRKLEETIQHQAHYDALTNLPNRLFFMELLTIGLAQARRNRKKLALMFLDLNGFKQVNDTFGHNYGDRLLQEVARRLKASVRETDTVARLGGDEFTVLMPDLIHSDDVQVVLKKILGVFETPFELDGVSIESSTSIGISLFPGDGICSEELMKKADGAMYAAKGSSINSFKYVNAKTNEHFIFTRTEQAKTMP